ncbi:MAG TPA: cation:proton antiporter, partial [bacterium]
MQHSEVISLFVILGVMLVTAKGLGELARKFGQPAVFGEILAGVILGPTVFGTLFPEFDAWLVPTSGNVATFLSGFYALAVAMFLLGAGMEVNLSAVMRQGKEAFSLSISGIVFPFALGFASAWYFPRLLGSEEQT